MVISAISRTNHLLFLFGAALLQASCGSDLQNVNAPVRSFSLTYGADGAPVPSRSTIDVDVTQLTAHVATTSGDDQNFVVNPNAAFLVDLRRLDVRSLAYHYANDGWADSPAVRFSFVTDATEKVVQIDAIHAATVPETLYGLWQACATYAFD